MGHNSSRFNPSPRNQRRNGAVAETTLPSHESELAQLAAQGQLPNRPGGHEEQVVAAMNAQAAETVRITLFQGADTVASREAAFARKTPESSLNAGLYGRVQLRVGEPLTIQIGSALVAGSWRQFSSLNWGWYFNVGKLSLSAGYCQCGGSVTVNRSKDAEPAKGTLVDCQVSINATVIHSKLGL